MDTVVKIFLSLGDLGQTLWHHLGLDWKTVIQILIGVSGLVASGSFALARFNVMGLWNEYLDVFLFLRPVKGPSQKAVLDVELKIRNRSARKVMVDAERSCVEIMQEGEAKGEEHRVEWEKCASLGFRERHDGTHMALSPRDARRLIFHTRLAAGRVYLARVKVFTAKGGIFEAERTFYLEGEGRMEEAAAASPAPDAGPAPEGEMNVTVD